MGRACITRISCVEAAEDGVAASRNPRRCAAKRWIQRSTTAARQARGTETGSQRTGKPLPSWQLVAVSGLFFPPSSKAVPGSLAIRGPSSSVCFVARQFAVSLSSHPHPHPSCFSTSASASVVAAIFSVAVCPSFNFVSSSAPSFSPPRFPPASPPGSVLWTSDALPLSPQQPTYRPWTTSRDISG